MRVSAICGPVIYVSRVIAFVGILLISSACSPYLYEKEITLFNKGIDNTVASFEELKQKERERRVAKRNENLKNDNRFISLTEGCDMLRSKYEEGFNKEAKILLTEADYQDCQIIPVGEPRIDPLLPNLTAIGEELKHYAVALSAVSNAEDVTKLQSAFTEFNTNIKELLKAVNQELSERGEQKFDTVAGLVYQAGIIYLNQRRFNALKNAVNETHPIIKKAAELLAEGSFDMYGPELSAQNNKLITLRIAVGNATGDDYVTAWHALKAERDTYVELFRSSPVGVFQELIDTHEALRQSVNDPNNKDQIEQVLANAKAFHNNAKAALDLFKKMGKDGDGTGG